ncbi:asparagine synthase (glutamine-hydrolyzing) [Kiloniella sp. b19]|uniref:asparagine synthase (glutamine-hydrolyzing) n=1 Tax=Kiloniella sp. GXU_MW_B19 TaxID=3141326 RepID=UPI0031D933DC
MCGITGFLVTASNHQSPAVLQQDLAQATDSLLHRGPDAHAHWISDDRKCGLGHTRLAIQDLSPSGQQPMQSACGRYWMAFNGEVFNRLEILETLQVEQKELRGHSDTEVMLLAIARLGLEKAVTHFIGQFAFALWDDRDKRFFLVRDRLGIKPLYWSNQQGLITFGSELKSLLHYTGCSRALNTDAIANYLKLGYIPAPHSIYRGIQKQTPGTILSFNSDGSCQETPFWSMKEVVRHTGNSDKIVTLDEAVRAIEPILEDAVQKRMIADVELGAFLSGGLDSSLITALMQKNSTRPVRTFSIGFDQEGYNEAEHAKLIAQHLGTEHTELYVTEQDLLSEVSGLMKVYDEPFADSSQIPTKLLSRLTREHVTVALSGDGGDEVFAGYNRYLHLERIQQFQNRFPSALVRLGARALSHTPPSIANNLASVAFGRTKARQMDIGRRLLKTGRALAASGSGAAYDAIVTQWDDLLPEQPAGTNAIGDLHFSRDEALFQYLDTVTYLPDDILTKVDRASMAHALEVRVPFLDHRVIEKAWQIDTAVHLQKGTGKRVTREILYKHVPRELVERPKQGFAIPINQWLRNDLRDWANSLLTETDWHGAFGMNSNRIHQIWKKQLSGHTDAGDKLWTLLMLAEWQKQENRT